MSLLFSSLLVKDDLATLLKTKVFPRIELHSQASLCAIDTGDDFNVRKQIHQPQVSYPGKARVGEY